MTGNTLVSVMTEAAQADHHSRADLIAVYMPMKPNVLSHRPPQHPFDPLLVNIAKTM